MIKLVDLLSELDLTDHYKKRKRERVDNILDLYISKNALGNFTLDQVKEPLIKYIQNVLYKKLSDLENKDTVPLSETYRVGYKFFIPVIETGGRKYSITLTTLEGTGTYYYVIVKENSLVSVIISDAEDFGEEVRKHSKRKYGDEPVKILEFPEALYPIDLNKVMGVEVSNKKVSKEDLPYKVKSDYRTGSKFIHNDYGTGTVVTTSVGTKGDPGISGVLDWIEVDFGKPFVSGGKLQKTRKIPNVYTTTYFK